MAHDPSLGFADYFSAADAAAASVGTLMPAMDEGPPELYGLHAGMEMLGMRGLAPTSAASVHGHSSKAVLMDDGADSATMRYYIEQHQHQHQQQQQQHQQQPGQVPLSLSLYRPEDVLPLHQHLGGGPSRQHQASWMQQQQHDTVPHGHGHGHAAAAWHLRKSRFLQPAQQLLQGFCSLPIDGSRRAKAPKPPPHEDGGEVSSSSTSMPPPSAQIQAMDALELQRLKDKLYIMLEEVDRRYRRYCEQMRALAGGFEAVAGERSSAAYTSLASRTISRHFRNLRDGIVGQLQAVRKALGEKDVTVPGMTRGDTPRLKVLDQCIRQQKALHQNGGMMESHPWRPQRGLPERAVTVLRSWLFEHFLHPYPSDVDKHILARQTGLSRSQVSNWFINARVRLWKPMVEEMYVEEMKEDQDGGGGGQESANPNPSSSHASDGGQQQAAVDDGDHEDGGRDQKPTRAQLLHDAGSLASVVNISGATPPGAARMENFGIMEHLDFGAYGDGQGGFGGGGTGGGVSLTLGLQQHDSHDGGNGVNIAFGAPSVHGGFLFPGEQMDGTVHSGGHGHHVQFGAPGVDGEASHAQEHYRGLNAGFHLLRDLAG